MRPKKKITLKRIINWVCYQLNQFFFKRLFALWQSLGFHITKNHYYQPIPDTRSLKNTIWENPSAMVGVEINENQQLRLLSQFVNQYKSEYDGLPMAENEITEPRQYYVNNTYFESVDGEILYCMVRHFKPKKIIEIGSGYSTILAGQAALKNQSEGNICDLIAIEPYPRPFLKQGFTGLSKLIVSQVQDIPLHEFEGLCENDILFIDSSHILKIGSDVQFEFLEILPRLRKGVVIHIHDIYLPAEYPKRSILREHNFYNEQYLLQAFLSFNNSFEVLWGGSFMHLKHPAKLEQAFRSYQRDQRWPASFWIRKKQ